jgi:2-aminoadipate transaminase
VKAALEATLATDGARSLQYFVTEGHPGLKGYLCDWLAKTQNIICSPEEMILTNGSQQGLDLIGKIFINPGDSVLVEDPTYLGAIQSFNPYQPRYVTVPLEQDGSSEAAIAEAISRQPIRFIYTVPTFQNPSGLTTSLQKREVLLEVAAKKNIPIVEDDPYSRLRFKGKDVPSLFSLKKSGGVIHLGTFSKILSPGIRLGYLIANKETIQQIVYAKQAADLQSNTLVQHAVYHYCRQGNLEKHIPLIIKNYGNKASIMTQAIRELFPKEVQFVEPEGGMFVWCRLPASIRASDLFKLAIANNVAFVEGSVFHANGGGENTMRLNFTNSTPDDIRLGIARLAEAIRKLSGQ